MQNVMKENGSSPVAHELNYTHAWVSVKKETGSWFNKFL